MGGKIITLAKKKKNSMKIKTQAGHHWLMPTY
jgi:hypothetical protein